MLNWLYVDKDTGAVRYGSRKDTVGHVIGPWGWSEDEQFLAIDDDDWRFIAVEEDVPMSPPSAPTGDGDTDGAAASGEKEEEQQETWKCWAIYLSRDRDGSLKPKAERKGGSQQQEGEGEGESEDDDEGEEGVDVRYTNNWAPIRLLRKLQLGVDSSYVKGSQSGNR